MPMFTSQKFALQGLQAVSADKHDRRSEMRRCLRLIYGYLGMLLKKIDARNEVRTKDRDGLQHGF